MISLIKHSGKGKNYRVRKQKSVVGCLVLAWGQGVGLERRAKKKGGGEYKETYRGDKSVPFMEAVITQL
jgi:hypothetical protein